MVTEEKQSSAASNAVYQIVYQVLTTATPLITTPIVARELGATNIGIYQYTLSIQAYFSLFAMLSFVNYGTRTIAETPKNKKNLSDKFWSVYSFQLLTSITAFLLYAVYAYFAHENQLIVILQGIWVLANIFDINWFFFGIEQFKITVTRNIVIKFLTVLAIVLFVRADKAPLVTYTCIMTIGNLLGLLVLFPMLGKYISFKIPDFGSVLMHVKPVLVLFIPLLALSVFHTMDKTMLGKLASFKELGYYSNSDKIIQIPLGIISGLGTVFLPRCTNLFSQSREQGISFLSKTYEFICFLTFALSFGIAGCSEKFVPLFFGKGYERCIILVYYFVPVLIFKSISSFYRMEYLVPNHQDRLFVIATICGAFSNLFCNFIFIPKYGAAGAVFGTLIAEAVVCIVQFFSYEKDMPIIKWFSTFLIYLVNGSVMLFMMRCLLFESLNSIWNVIIQICVGGICFIAMTLVYWYISGKYVWIFGIAKSLVPKNK